MIIHITHHHPDLERELKRINESLNNITHQNLIIMATIAELSAKADKLQAAIDLEQEQVATVIQGLKDANAALQVIIDAGGTVDPAELQALSDKLDTAISDLESTIPE